MAVNNAGVLGGTGSVAGNVTLNNSAVLTPKTNTQIADLVIGGSLTFNNTSSLYAQIAGAVAGTSYDQVIVNGGVTINTTAILAGTTSVSQAQGTDLTLIDKTSGGPITGNFSNAVPPSPPATVMVGARAYSFNMRPEPARTISYSPRSPARSRGTASRTTRRPAATTTGLIR